ncbi:MAG: tRNA pseudouridine(38-40) synthase TruA [Rickettsiales bacterium]
MPRYKLTIEYDGTPYAGWQRQDGPASVQQTLEEAVFKFCGKETELYCAGRTDAGVHALGQVAHIDLAKSYPPFTIMQAINFHMIPHPIVVTEVEEVDDIFHARFTARKRYYLYRILNRRARLGIDVNRAWHVSVPLDVARMQQAANRLLGTHDFTSFRDTECQAKSPVKTLDHFSIEQLGDEIRLQTHSRSFLHHQVRIMVGTLMVVGKGDWEPEDITRILAAKDRKAAGPTAPAEGLFLTRVDYEL